jgi:hypothetical protein
MCFILALAAAVRLLEGLGPTVFGKLHPETHVCHGGEAFVFRANNVSVRAQTRSRVLFS